MGRPSIGNKPMTPAERHARWLENKKVKRKQRRIEDENMIKRLLELNEELQTKNDKLNQQIKELQTKLVDKPKPWDGRFQKKGEPIYDADGNRMYHKELPMSVADLYPNGIPEDRR